LKHQEPLVASSEPLDNEIGKSRLFAYIRFLPSEIVDEQGFIFHSRNDRRRRERQAGVSGNQAIFEFMEGMPDKILLLVRREYGFYAIYIWRTILIDMSFPGAIGQFRRRASRQCSYKVCTTYSATEG
jgi:hypothetical protein